MNLLKFRIGQRFAFLMFSITYLLAGLMKTIAQPPGISAVVPDNAPVGDTIIIYGSNFSTTVSNNIVFLGGVKANVVAAGTDSLRVVVPIGSGA
ncbi:MAG: IPT/TIG domain-containing protein [Bacteroidetes bacterium]|nr:IPT/TIG domain-containing protein [Bacteroidota bacterium]